MDYKQKYFKYKQKYLNLLKDQKGGEPFLIDFSAKQVYLWLFAKNQRQLDFIFTGRQISFTMPPLENITLNHQHRLSLLTKGSLSVVLASKLVPKKYLARRILSRLHVLPRISPPTCIATKYVITSSINSIAFHPTLPLLATGCTDRFVRLWNCSELNPTLIKDLPGHTNLVNSVAFHPSLPLLASGSDDTTVRLWNYSDPKKNCEEEILPSHTDSVRSVAFHPTRSLLASGSHDRTVRLWNYSDPQKKTLEVANLHDHTNWIRSVAFHPTLPLLATGSSDRTIILWDCSDPENTYQVAILTGHIDLILSIAFHPTLPFLASVSMDNRFKIWQL